jgi:hypothetical protein
MRKYRGTMIIPKTRQWVTDLSNCSQEGAFLVLCEVIDSDVKEVNGLQRHDVSFECTRPAAGKLIVIRTRSGIAPGTASVVFELNRKEITATARDSAGAADLILSVTPNLNEEGDCTFNDGERNLYAWQVSRKALEALFFGF